jgi:dynein heavy chain
MQSQSYYINSFPYNDWYIFLVQVLKETLTNLHAAGEKNPFYQPCHTHVLNPKSITMEELYGGINKLTLEWSDGLMAMTVRACVQVRGL